MQGQSYQRPPSSRQPHGMRPPSSRTKLGNNIPVPSRDIAANRPTTKQGLPSAHTTSGQRQVADSKFYIGILRQRINEIVKEIERLKGDIETRKRGQSIQVSLQQEVNDLRAQISQSEAELADYNVLADRLSNKVSLDEMQSSLNELTISNSQLEKEADRLFRERRDLEAIVTDQESQVQEIMRGNGSPQLQELTKELESLEKQCNELRGKTGDLQGKTREQLNQMVKEATQQMGDIDKQIQDEQKSLQYVQQQIKAYEAREADQQTDRGRKYLTLLSREKEMNNFIKNFPTSLEAAKKDLEASQKRVIDILGETARDLECLDKMPTIDNYKQLQQDLKYKELQMNNAQTTTIQLQAEVEQRRRELEDLQNVDQKIKQEEELLQKQMEDMTAEMPNFQDVDGVREEGELKKKQKTEERDSLKSQLKNLKKATNAAATKFNETKASIRTNETYLKLHQLEKELQTKALDNHAIIEFIEEDRRKTNYAMVKRQALSIVNDINDGL